MKRFNLSSTVVLFIVGAVTAFLWLPLLPLLVPLVTLTVGMRWISANLDSEGHLGSKVPTSKLLYFPAKHHISPSQASQPTAWPSSVSLPSPARAGSLPLHSELKNFKKQLRKSRQVARVLSGMELRRSASASL